MKSTFCDGITRREALRVGVLGSLGLGLADFLRLAQGNELSRRAEAVIFVNLKGGPSHLDTLDMKPDAPADERGEFKSIPSKLPGLRVCEHLPKFAQVADQFTLIRGISHAVGDHPQADEYLYTGNRPVPAVKYPCCGSVLLKERPMEAALPGFVAVPATEMHPGHLGVAFAPFKTNAVPKAGKPFEVRGLGLAPGLSIDKVKERQQLLEDIDNTFRRADANSQFLDGLDRFGKQAHAMILSPRAREAFDTGKESPAIAKLFADDSLGQCLLLATRLVQYGVRFVTVGESAGWDTHLDNFNNLKNKLLPPLDRGLPALVTALKAKGLLDKTLVVVTGEFGRTPKINKNAGRDHWPRAMWTLVTGGGVQAGRLIGGTDRNGHAPDDDTRLKPDDLAATIYYALGIDPGKEYHTPTGRPVYLVRDGKVIKDVFA